jgi:hypothetical protein
VSATFALLKEMFPDSSAVAVLLDVYQVACQKIGREAAEWLSEEANTGI